MTKRDYYEDKEILHPENKVDLETRTFYRDKGVPTIVWAVGLGGCARRDALVDGLVERGYKVRAFSPRNSGESTGNLTVGNYISDLEFVLEDTANKLGEKPFGVGHSTGGYALAKVLGGKDSVEKGVLLAPLLDIIEQNPKVMERYLRGILKDGEIPVELSVILDLYHRFLSPEKSIENGDGVRLDQQRFTKEGVLSFLESLYSSKSCDKKMQVPTYVLLSGKTNLGLRVHNLNTLKNKWKKLQGKYSKADTFLDLDHYFSNGGEFFESKRKEDVLDKIDGFLRK